MTVELYQGEKALIVENIDPGWIATALLFFGTPKNIPPDRAISLPSTPQESSVLHTFIDPRHQIEDTVGLIETTIKGRTQRTFLNETRPYYISASKRIGQPGYAINTILLYRPNQIRKNFS